MIEKSNLQSEKIKHITMQFKLTAFYAFGIFEILKVDDPLKVSCSK